MSQPLERIGADRLLQLRNPRLGQVAIRNLEGKNREPGLSPLS